MIRLSFIPQSLLLPLLAFALLGCDTPDDNQLAANLEMYRTTWDKIMNEGQLDEINEEHFTPDVVAVVDGDDIEGIDGFRDFYGAFLTGFSDIDFETVDLFGQGDKMVKHWRFRGKHTGEFFGIPATGNDVDMEGTTLITMRDGRIAREQDFMDNMAMMQQLGVASDPENMAVIDELYQNFAANDMPAALAAMDAEIEWNEAEGNALADGNPYIGPDAVVEGVFSRLGAEHEYFNLKDVQLHEMSGNRVLATLRYDAKRKDTGKLIDAQVAHLWTLRDGKAIAFQQYTDTRQLAEAAAK